MFIKSITDNGGKTLDRYTVYFWDGDYLTLSENCDTPQGVSQTGHLEGIQNAAIEPAAQSNHIIFNNQKMINFFDLPENVQEHVIRRIKDIDK